MVIQTRWYLQLIINDHCRLRVFDNPKYHKKNPETEQFEFPMKFIITWHYISYIVHQVLFQIHKNNQLQIVNAMST